LPVSSLENCHYHNRKPVAVGSCKGWSPNTGSILPL